MHPIHYSLIINGIAMLVGGLLAYFFASPLLFLVIMLTSNHMVGRFGKDDAKPVPEREAGIGFLANVDQDDDY